MVGRLGAAFVAGAQRAGVLATAKHFPGHGDTEVDSHLSLPLICGSASGAWTASSGRPFGRRFGPAS